MSFITFIFLQLMWAIPILIFRFFHNKNYKELKASLESRFENVWGKYELECGGGVPTNTSGAMPQLKYIENKFGAQLNIVERKLVQKSRIFYNLQAIPVLLFMVLLYVSAKYH